MAPLKNTKQESTAALLEQIEVFCSRVKSGIAVAVASDMAGLRLTEPRDLHGFYVYLLIDPRSDEVFYVGKGSGVRCFTHEKQSAKRKGQNERKQNRILAILASGHRTKISIIAHGLTSETAIYLESAVIAGLGRGILTNALGETVSFRYRMWRVVMGHVLNVMPYIDKAREAPDSEEKREWFGIVNFFIDTENKLRPADEAMFDLGTRKEIQAWRVRFKERKMQYLARILAELERRGVSLEQPDG